MLRLLVLIPIILCLLWTIYLRSQGYRLSDGKKGYVHIIVISAVIILFYSMMYLLTQTWQIL